MGKPIIEANVDVTKLLKEHFFVGAKGKYADFAFFERADERSDGFVVQKVSKAARERGEKGPIVGNWKWVEKPTPQPPQQRQSNPSRQYKPNVPPPVDPDLDGPEETF